MTNPRPSQPSSFALQFGRLLSQRTREPNNVDAQRIALDELAATNAGAVRLVWDNWQLRAGSEALSASEPGMLDLLSRMAAHGVRELTFADTSDRSQLLRMISSLS